MSGDTIFFFAWLAGVVAILAANFTRELKGGQ
jgi:hypothetical protein